MKFKGLIPLLSILLAMVLLTILFLNPTVSAQQNQPVAAVEKEAPPVVPHADDPDFLGPVNNERTISTEKSFSIPQTGGELSLTTFFAPNNGQRGNMFDVIAGPQPICITRFDVNMYADTTARYELWIKPGTWDGFENDPSAWTFIGGLDNLTSNGYNIPTPFNLGGVGVSAGQRVALYVTNTSGGGLNYTNSDGTAMFSNSDLTITDGIGKSYPFSENFYYRTTNVTIYYVLDPTGLCITTDVGITLTNEDTEVTPGNPVTYTLFVNQTGAAPLSNVAVSDLFDPNLSDITWSCVGSNATCTANGVGNINDTVSIEVGGYLSYTVHATLAADTTEALVNTATVTPPPLFIDLNPDNNTATNSAPLAPTRCNLLEGQAYFYDGMAVSTTLANIGDIECLTIARTNNPHPNATASMTDGYYWQITGTNQLELPASNYDVSLTLPHNGDVNPTICRYPGGLGGYGWDCTGTQSYDATTVTRSVITEFSDWAIGYDVGPTTITLQGAQAASGIPVNLFLPSLLTLFLVSTGLWAYRRRLQAKKPVE